ncbi:MAG: type II toxin-antitoxin system YoeB family toxin [Verrucomicrobiota bacterium]
MAEFWSRRIDQEFRLVFLITEQGILLAQMRYHY